MRLKIFKNYQMILNIIKLSKIIAKKDCFKIIQQLLVKFFIIKI